MLSQINTAFIRLERRAEQRDPAFLVQTFVDAGPLFALISSNDHQVVYGRRGTGKTHALQYLKARVADQGDHAVLLDLRTLGSSGGLYGDDSVPLAERATRLMSDVLSQVIEDLTDYALSESDSADLTSAMRLVERLEDAAIDVRVTGTVETEDEQRGTSESTRDASAEVRVDSSAPSASGRAGRSSSRSDETARRSRVVGVEEHHVHFGQVATVLARLIEALPSQRLWLLLDEWVAIPPELQPLLADFLKRALLPVPGVTVKIAAIEQRSFFRTGTLGVELGADIQADVDLDDFMVFDNDADKAKEFFRELLHKHVKAVLEDGGQTPPATALELQRTAFTQRNAIDDFVRAAEGVPRDAINILRLAAQRADSDPIAVEHVRSAARRWYLGDKEKDVPEAAKALLHWIVDEVIGGRRARAFLLEQQRRDDPLISELFDSRVLHVMRRGVAAQDRAGVRFDVYAIDYGCYVELINTARAPEGLFQVDDDGAWVEVPANDYRSIRRAILDLDAFGQRQPHLLEDQR